MKTRGNRRKSRLASVSNLEESYQERFFSFEIVDRRDITHVTHAEGSLLQQLMGKVRKKTFLRIARRKSEFIIFVCSFFGRKSF